MSHEEKQTLLVGKVKKDRRTDEEEGCVPPRGRESQYSVESESDTDGYYYPRWARYLVMCVAMLSFIAVVVINMVESPPWRGAPTRKPIAKSSQAPQVLPQDVDRGATSPSTTEPVAPPPSLQPIVAPTSPTAYEKKEHFLAAMRCAGKADHAFSLKERMQVCAQSLVGNLIEFWGESEEAPSPNFEQEKASLEIARPLYSVAMAKATSSMSQASQCGPQDFMRHWDCPVCKEAGFQLVPETHRFVSYEELDVANSTFVLVSRMRGTLPHLVPKRPKEPLRNYGFDCWGPCGAMAGYCQWCGVGNACCGDGVEFDPPECNGIKTHTPYHTCVAPALVRVPLPVRNVGKDCYEPCGMTTGLCNFCGAGNACCRSGNLSGLARECQGATGFLTDGFECVAPSDSFHIPASVENDIGCMVIVRGSYNVQNRKKDIEFHLDDLPFSQCDGCRVHRGFHSVWRDVHMKVVSALASLDCLPGSQHSRILMTGESFGASVAIIGQFYLQSAGYTMEIGYNYGATRVGNAAWTELFDRWFNRPVPVFRVTHSHDIVSRLPPTYFMNYRHVRSEVFYPAEDADQYVVCLGGEDYECQNRYDLGVSLASTIAGYDKNGSLKSTPGEAFDIDHCYSGLAPDRDLCQCSLSPWWKWYKESGLLARRFDSAPDNSHEPRLAKGAKFG